MQAKQVGREKGESKASLSFVPVAGFALSAVLGKNRLGDENKSCCRRDDVLFINSPSPLH